MQLHRARKDFEAAGAELVLIGQATPRQAAHFRRRQKIDVPVLADEKLETYKLIGARKGGWGELLGPKVVAKGAITTLRTGAIQGRTVGSATQLGGALVIAPSGEIVFKHLAHDASDNASPQELLDAVRGVG
jgi:hypothetical protein